MLTPVPQDEAHVQLCAQVTADPEVAAAWALARGGTVISTENDSNASNASKIIE
jgi:hypothetical protein